MRAGVLIAGSLIWDTDALRVGWRAARLAVDDRVLLNAPLRYGRRSSRRSDTYTMVFSSACVDGGLGTGQGLAVPFKAQIKSVGDLACEAAELWRVERKSDSVERGVVSAPWGSVGLLIRPDCQGAVDVRAAWRRVIQGSPRYGNLAAAENEPLAVDKESGLAGFPWSSLGPNAETFDVLLFTATKPTLVDGQYASAETIAAAWNAAPLEAKYFKRNRAWGITTHQDEALEWLLV